MATVVFDTVLLGGYLFVCYARSQGGKLPNRHERHGLSKIMSDERLLITE